MTGIKKISVDATALLSSSCGGESGKAFKSKLNHRFITTQFNMNEAFDKIPEFVERKLASQSEPQFLDYCDRFQKQLHNLPVQVFSEEDYSEFMEQARKHILVHKGREKDVHLHALSIWQRVDLIWSNDPDFSNQNEIPVSNSFELLNKLGFPPPERKKKADLYTRDRFFRDLVKSTQRIDD